MKSISLEQLLLATNGQLISQHHEIFDGVGTDTRKDLSNQIFIALKGDNFDAHDYVDKAVQSGATALLVHQMTAKIQQLKEQVTIVQVGNTLKALQNLAHYMRHQSTAQIVGIAGSNGKTTSKEFCAALLGSVRKVHYSLGSFNNHWGVPFTLLAEPENTQISVVEMGMNHEGELAVLTKIADPDVVVCTYVGVEHMEYFGTLEKVAAAEEEIYNFSSPTAQRIYNIDNTYTKTMFETAAVKFPKSKLWTFSTEQSSAHVCLKIESITMSSMIVKGKIGQTQGQAEIPVFGAHNITNVMVAATVALACGLQEDQIWAALPLLKTNWGRNQLVQTQVGAEILFDAYNANPDSMKALIDNMKLLKPGGKVIGVFAEMKELGDQSAPMHQEVGEYVGHAAFDMIWFCGDHHQEFKEGFTKTKSKALIQTSIKYDESIANSLAKNLKNGDIVLVKGSRGMELERFVLGCQPLDFKAK